MIEIYGSPNCTYCSQAKTLCEKSNLNYTYTDLFEDPEALIQLTKKIGNFRSVPQIIFDGEHIGGFTELKERLNEN